VRLPYGQQLEISPEAFKIFPQNFALKDLDLFNIPHFRVVKMLHATTLFHDEILAR
jgi:hypothetical protein